LDDSDEPQWKVRKLNKGKPELVRESRPVLEESLEKKLENMGLRKVEHIIDTNVYILHVAKGSKREFFLGNTTRFHSNCEILL